MNRSSEIHSFSVARLNITQISKQFKRHFKLRRMTNSKKMVKVWFSLEIPKSELEFDV